MSNKEEITVLVERIQNGERDLMHELWSKVERLVAWQANRIVTKLPPSAGVTFDDFYNSGYIALEDAVHYYKPESGEFIALFMLCLKTAFAEASGFKSNKSKNDPIRQSNTASLDAPLDCMEDMTLCDTVADERNNYEGVEKRIFNEQLHKVLGQALSAIPPLKADALRRRYYGGLSAKETAEAIGVEPAKARQLERNALSDIRRSKYFHNLEQFVEGSTIYYKRGGVRRFNTTGTSTTEEIVLMRERLAKDYARTLKEREC